jgi:C-terminal processing protease CtpA/Prc
MCICVSRFARKPSLLSAAILKLRDAGAQSFVLDLQDNLGGLVQAGIEIARLFLDEGETVRSFAFATAFICGHLGTV